MRFRSLLTAILLCTLAVIMSGCATNIPVWERGHLAKTQMAVDPYPLQNHIQLHNYSSREAAASTHSIDGGGGCGCY